MEPVKKLFSKFSVRFIAITFFSGIIPIVILAVIISQYNNHFISQINQVIQQGEKEQWKRSNIILSRMAEDFIRQKALDTAFQLELYLKSYPDMTIDDLQKDAEFREIAVQPIGKSGYSAIVETNTAFCLFHKNPGLENADLHPFAEKLPEFWAIIEASLEGRYSHGYYKWKEPDGKISQKFMHVVPVYQKTADDVRLSVAATTTMDDFIGPIQAARDISRGTTLTLTKTIDKLIDSFKNLSYLFMGVSVVLLLLLASWSGFYFSRTISRLRNATKSVNQGDFNVKLDNNMSGDIGELINDFNQMVDILASTTVNKERLEKKQQELKTANVRLNREIVERKQAQENLSLMQFGVDHANDGIFWLNSKLDIRYVNNSVIETLGYTREELLSMNITQIDTRTPAESLPDRLAQLKRMKSDRFESHHHTKDGRVIPVEVTSNYIMFEGEEGVLSFSRDITARKYAEEQLLLSRQKLDLHFMRTPVAVVEWDLEFKIRTWNPAAENIFGYTGDEMDGVHISDIIPDRFKENVEPYCNGLAVQKEGSSRVITENITKDGEIIMCEWFNTPIINDYGETIAVVSLAQDITARKKAEKEKEYLKSQLHQAQKMESIGTLAGGIAHDFNNILFAINGLTALLTENLPEKSDEYQHACQILTAGRRGTDLVKQILVFSRQGKNEVSPIRLQYILKEVLKLVRATIPSNIEIIQKIQPDCGLVMADPIQVHQVLMNIITNAYHAIESNNGFIKVVFEEVWLEEDHLPSLGLHSGRYVNLSISDNGHGIPKALMNKIFDPYYTTKEKGKGTGLGLSVVYGIINELDGDIKIDSIYGKGTTVSIYLPLISQSAGEFPELAESELPTGSEHILIVDDEQVITYIEMEMFKKLGYEVTTRINSLDALETFKANPDKYDLVVTDQSMPKMTGMQLARKLREIRADVPVIIATGFNGGIKRQKLKQSGINGFLMKPIVTTDAANLVRKILDKNKNLKQKTG